MFRGLSQNDGQISPQADLHEIVGQGYGGISAQEVRRGIGQGAGAELIAYAGYQQSFGEDWSGRLNLRHYDYPGNSLRSRYDYDEIALSLGWRERLMLTAIASPDTYSLDYRGNFGTGAAYSYEFTCRQPLPWGLYGIAGVGYYDLRHQIGVGYAYWSAALEHRWRSFVFDLSYVGTDATARYHFEDDAGNRLVLSAFWLF